MASAISSPKTLLASSVTIRVLVAVAAGVLLWAVVGVVLCWRHSPSSGVPRPSPKPRRR